MDFRARAHPLPKTSKYSSDWKLNQNVFVRVNLHRLDLPNKVNKTDKKRELQESHQEMLTNKKLHEPDIPVVTAVEEIDISNVILECEPNCSVCDNFIMQLGQHIRDSHTNNNVQQRLQSSVPIETENLVEYCEDTSTDNFLFCEVCGDQFLEQDELNNHIENHPVTEIPSIPFPAVIYEIADVCEFQEEISEVEDSHFENFEEIPENNVETVIVSSVGPPVTLDIDHNYDYDHIVVQHGEPDPGPSSNTKRVLSNKKSKPRPKPPLDPKIKECGVCGKTGLNTRQLNKHIAKAHPGKNPFTCRVCESGFPTQFKLDVHNRSHPGEKTYFCDFESCNQGFTFKSSLTQHLRTHASVKRPNGCGLCEKTFTSPDLLRIHKRTHTGEKSFICEFCSQGFYDEGALKRHYKIHEGDNPMDCKVCGSTFYSRIQLSRHVRALHPEHRRHVCQICQKGYNKLCHLRNHVRTHTGEKPFVCTLCNRGFSLKVLLKNHIRTHTGKKPHVCEICKQTYLQKSGLKVHMRTHTGEKPFVCETCGKRFHSNGILTGHRRIHTNERPFSCKHCHKCFNQSSTLQGHLLIHSRQNPKSKTKPSRPRKRKRRRRSP